MIDTTLVDAHRAELLAKLFGDVVDFLDAVRRARPGQGGMDRLRDQQHRPVADVAATEGMGCGHCPRRGSSVNTKHGGGGTRTTRPCWKHWAPTTPASVLGHRPCRTATSSREAQASPVADVVCTEGLGLVIELKISGDRLQTTHALQAEMCFGKRAAVNVGRSAVYICRVLLTSI